MATISEALEIAIEHHQGGRLQVAEQIYRQILAADPDHADAHHLLGLVAHQGGNRDAAVEHIRRAIELQGNSPYFHYSLGEVYRSLRRMPEAIAAYRRAIELSPDYAAAHGNMANALRFQGNLDEAILSYRRAIELSPGSFEVHNNLGNALNEQGKPDDALHCYRRAAALRPDFAEAHYNIGTALKDQGYLDEAIACYRRAVELKPGFVETHCNLGMVFKEQGRLDEAISCYGRALELNPSFADAHSNLVYAQVFSPGYDAHELYEAHCRWNRCHAAPLADSIQPHRNDPFLQRRLKIGYVSPDFRNHCQAFFTVPLFSSHDHENFEITCYSDVARPDGVTDRLRSYADVWRSIAGLGDEQVAQAIREDEIDILVDLTMHMGGNRLLVFARKPAPVQVCWLAYPGTTGLATIEYRLTDPYLDPPDLDDRFYSEESIRLPDSFWCYDPLASEPPVNGLPAEEKGFVTFGCLNNFCKVNPPVVKLWAQVLAAVDRSRLMILAREGTHRQNLENQLEAEGAGRNRVTFVAHQPRAQYLRHYHDIDIGLDTFPYNGHTTSLDSMWMGVPVMTLAGTTVVGRAGVSQLTNLGLTDLIASSPEQYIRIAAELARDLPHLSRLRASLRQRMQASPLMNAPRFARNMEAAYRQMWKRWCAMQNPVN